MIVADGEWFYYKLSSHTFECRKTLLSDYKFKAIEFSTISKCVNIQDTKQKAADTIQPALSKSGVSCGLMLLTNMAEPQWIYVPCDQRILSAVVCFQPMARTNTSQNYLSLEKVEMCHRHHLTKHSTCLLFLWFSTNTSHSVKHLCRKQESTTISLTDISQFVFLFVAVAVEMPPFLFTDRNIPASWSGTFKYKRYSDSVHYVYLNTSQAAHGIQICKTEKVSLLLESYLFKCSNYGVYISVLHVCDAIADCPGDQSDEQFCLCKEPGTTTLSSYPCKSVVLENNKTVCSKLYFMGNDFTCHKYVVKEQNTKGLGSKIEDNVFHCDDGPQMDQSLKDDLVPDCPDAEDEPILQSVLKHNTQYMCTRPEEIPCLQGHPHCFNFSDICVFKMNSQNLLVPCRNGEHVLQCAEFECSMMFKCSNSYCIPWKTVCNGKWDCNTGEDEDFGPVCSFVKEQCSQMYKCKFALKTCIHIGNVCDGNVDCAHGDDEYLCQLKNMTCPQRCNCLAHAIACSFLPDARFLTFHVYQYIHLSNCPMPKSLTREFPHAFILHMTDFEIYQLCESDPPEHLLMLSLVSRSDVDKSLSANCFPTPKLISLDISNNKIVFVKPQSFANLYTLTLLNLSDNPLQSLPDDLAAASSLKLFSLKNVSLAEIHSTTLDGFSVQLIEASDTRVCCVAPAQSNCTAAPPWFSSCSHVLPSTALKGLFTAVSVSIVVLNMMTVHMNVNSEEAHGGYVMTAVTMSVTHMLCGVYLGFTWVTDQKYGAEFFAYEEVWRSGAVCFTSYCVILWFILQTQSVSAFMSLSRLMVVAHPMDTKLKRIRFVLKSLVFVVAASLLCSVTVTVVVKFVHRVLSFRLCFPFTDPAGATVTNILVWITSLSQTAAALAISVMHIQLVCKVLESQKVVKQSKSQSYSNTGLVVQLVVLTTSLYVCWVPAAGVYLSTLFVGRFPPELILWTVGGILPINSLINPCVLIVTFVRKSVKTLVGKSMV